MGMKAINERLKLAEDRTYNEYMMREQGIVQRAYERGEYGEVFSPQANARYTIEMDKVKAAFKKEK